MLKIQDAEEKKLIVSYTMARCRKQEGIATVWRLWSTKWRDDFTSGDGCVMEMYNHQLVLSRKKAKEMAKGYKLLNRTSKKHLARLGRYLIMRSDGDGNNSKCVMDGTYDQVMEKTLMERITRHKFVARLYEKLGSQFYSCRLSKNFTCTDSYWVTKAVFEYMTDILKEGNILFVTECFTIQRKFKAERVVGNFGTSNVVPAHGTIIAQKN